MGRSPAGLRRALATATLALALGPALALPGGPAELTAPAVGVVEEVEDPTTPTEDPSTAPPTEDPTTAPPPAEPTTPAENPTTAPPPADPTAPPVDPAAPVEPTPSPEPAPEPEPEPEPTVTATPEEPVAALADLPDSPDPFGQIDSVTVGAERVSATGWAIDADTTGPIIVQMYVDYAANTATWADDPRPDVAVVYPTAGPNHGYTLTMATPAGSHTICVYAVNTGPGTSTSLGCRQVSVPGHDPFGTIDAVRVGPEQVSATGWAIDADTTGPIIVQMYVDYAANTATWADDPRPDVARVYPWAGPNHGWTMTMAVAPGTHTVCVFAVDTGPGESRSLGCRKVTVPGHDPFGQIDSVVVGADRVTLSGWAIDADTTGPIIVQMYVDYAANTATWADDPRPDVARVYPWAGPNHGWTLSMPVATGTHTVCVYAVDTGPGESRSLGCRVVRLAPDCDVLRCIALTFDDGPGASTNRLLDILTGAGVRATFFLVGSRIDSYATVVRRMASTGMEVANHSWSHPDLTTLTASAISSQLSTTSTKITSVTGRRPTLMRPPYGARNATTDSISGQLGMAVILWSIDTLDWRYLDSARLRSVVAANATPGAIVLMHDIHATTVDAVPGIISDLRSRGYTLVTVSELIGSPAPGVVYSRQP
ncbi:polysaccharide deacetylase family protein [Georgenia sp. M64]|uniref:polysaccharide deacetylase family protein n=1 Tax=Georgenia sp. M64 TaxID=3120520 RepID=UPI0030E1AC5D